MEQVEPVQISVSTRSASESRIHAWGPCVPDSLMTSSRPIAMNIDSKVQPYTTHQHSRSFGAPHRTHDKESCSQRRTCKTNQPSSHVWHGQKMAKLMVSYGHPSLSIPQLGSLSQQYKSPKLDWWRCPKMYPLPVSDGPGLSMPPCHTSKWNIQRLMMIAKWYIIW